MSLTSHLKDPESPVRQFIYECAPELALAGTRGAQGKAVATHFDFDKLTALETQIPIPAEVKRSQRKSHAIAAGIALDYRIRMSMPGFDVTETTAWKGLERLRADPNIVHRGRHIASLLQDALNFAFLTLREKDPHPLSLARVSVPLAWCEAIYRAGPITALRNDLGRQIKRAKTAVELMMSIDESLIFDIATMHKSLGPLLEEWNRAVSDDFDYTPNPTFPVALAIGGADADLAINDLLVDFKTREEITNPWLRDTLFQLLGYTLLDLDDSLGIRRVAILLPRQPYIAIWKLDDLLGRDADEVLPKLREAFAGVLATVLASQLGVHETEDKEPGYEADKLTTQSVTLSPSETSSGTLRNGFDAGTPTELD